MNLVEVVWWSVLGSLAFFYVTYASFMFYETKKPSNIKKRRIFPQVSVIIPTYNEEDTILRKLKNLKSLNYPKERLEVIIIDGASTDKTMEIVKEFQENNPCIALHLISEKERSGKANALNNTFPRCSGEIIIISDADSLLQEDSLAQVTSNFLDPTIGAATGRQILLNAGQSLATNIEKGYRDLYEVLRVGESNLDSTTIFHGELSAFRRDLVEMLAKDSVADDTELAIRIREKGYRTIYDPEAIFYEYAPPTLKARNKQKQRRGYGLIQQFIRFRHLMFKRTYGKYGLIIFPCEFFMHVISPFLIGALIVLSALLLTTNPYYLLFMTAAFVVFFIAAMCLTNFLKFVLPKKRIPNLLSIGLAFLHSQLCLLLGYFSMAKQRTAHQWEKIEEIRALWKS